MLAVVVVVASSAVAGLAPPAGAAGDRRATPQATTLPASGSYSGNYFVAGTQGALSFYVAPGQAAIEDVTANVSMRCTPGGTSSGGFPFVIDSFALPSVGAFATTSTETAEYGGSPAKVTFEFQGHVRGAKAFAGSLTEKLTYRASGTTYKCTSTRLRWSAARDSQPTPQPTTLPASGSYSGHYFVAGTQGALSFYVAPDQSRIEDVSANVTTRCSPGGQPSSGWPFVIDSLALPSDGSFATTTTETGEAAGSLSKVTLDFQGHVHGVDAAGAARLAGSLILTMTYRASGTAYKCTSDKLPWYAVRDNQPTPQPRTAPPSGSYAGHYFVGSSVGGLTFSVASNQKAIQDVTTNLTMRCSPGGASSGGVVFVVDSFKLPAGGTFATTSTRTGEYSGNPATFTFDFQGHVHGVDATSAARLAGSLTATMTYSASGTAYKCTSDKLPWYATGP